jgi:hypothetical protein
VLVFCFVVVVVVVVYTLRITILNYNIKLQLSGILGSYDIAGSMISRYLHFLRLRAKATPADAAIFINVTLNRIAFADKYNFVNNECIPGKKSFLYKPLHLTTIPFIVLHSHLK